MGEGDWNSDLDVQIHHDPDSEWVLVWTKDKPDVALRLPLQAWKEFIASLRAGEFDLPLKGDAP